MAEAKELVWPADGPEPPYILKKLPSGDTGRPLMYKKPRIVLKITVKELALAEAKPKCWLELGSSEQKDEKDFYFYDGLKIVSVGSTVTCTGFITHDPALSNFMRKIYRFYDDSSEKPALVVLWCDPSDQTSYASKCLKTLNKAEEQKHPVDIRGFPRIWTDHSYSPSRSYRSIFISHVQLASETNLTLHRQFAEAYAKLIKQSGK